MAGAFEYSTEILGSIEEGNSLVAERLLPSAERIRCIFWAMDLFIIKHNLKVPVFKGIFLKTYKCCYRSTLPGKCKKINCMTYQAHKARH